VVACDRDGLIVRRASIVAPVALAQDGAGGVFIASALERTPDGAHQLVHVTALGATRRVAACAALGVRVGEDWLSADRRTGALVVLERAGGGRVATLHGAPSPLAAGVLGEVAAPLAEGVTLPLGFEPACARFGGGRLWVVGTGGEVVALENAHLADLRAGSRSRAEVRPAAVAASDRLAPGARGVRVAPDADGAGAWILARAGPDTSAGAAIGRWQLDGGGRARRVWARGFDLEPGALAATGVQAAWITDARARLLVGVGGGGRVGVWRRDLPAAGAEDMLATADGGAWIAAGGALLRVDRYGRSAPGQGGFGHLVALAADHPA